MNKTKRNTYKCETCGGQILTVNQDEGVTPMFLSCCLTEGCEGRMMSGWYSPMFDLMKDEPTHEWYRPTREEAKAMDKEFPGMLHHIKMGGLVLREIVK